MSHVCDIQIFRVSQKLACEVTTSDGTKKTFRSNSIDDLLGEALNFLNELE